MAFNRRPIQHDGPMTDQPRPQRQSRPGKPRPAGPPKGPRRSAPPETTNAETFYYLKQMNAKTPMVVVLRDGERLHGWIEWYDRNSIKLNRPLEPNLLILKRNIKYMHKDQGDDPEE